MDIQQVAMFFAKGYCASGVDDFAHCGSHCTHIKTCSRDLHRPLLMDCSVPTHYLATCPITMPKKDDTTYVEHLVLLPAEIFMWLLATKKVTLPGITNLSQITHVTLSNTLVQTCQTHHLPPCYTTTLGFHCDGLPVANSQHTAMPAWRR